MGDTGLVESLIFILTSTITELSPHQPATFTHPTVNNTKEAAPFALHYHGLLVWLFHKEMDHLLGHRKTQEVINIQ